MSRETVELVKFKHQSYPAKVAWREQQNGLGSSNPRMPPCTTEMIRESRAILPYHRGKLPCTDEKMEV